MVHYKIVGSALSVVMFIVLLSVSSLMAAGQSKVPQPIDHTKVPHQSDHMIVIGVVTVIKSGIITVQTPVGHLSLNRKAGLAAGEKEVHVGDHLTMWVNGDNMVMDVHVTGAAPTKHRFLMGKLAFANSEHTVVTFWTPEGSRTFPILVGKERLSGIGEGVPVRVEVNEAGQVIDVHKIKDAL